MENNKIENPILVKLRLSQLFPLILFVKSIYRLKEWITLHMDVNG